MSRQQGLIIGINHYQDPTFRPLQFAENDARALAQWLVNGKGGKWSPPDVQLVQGQHATRELMESLLTQICLNTAQPGDLALIYFAGHAFVDERSGEGYLALSNTNYQNAATGLHLHSFVNYIMARSRATHILCILDCFQTGPVWDMRRTSLYDPRPLFTPALQNTLQQQQNRLFLCTCRGNERAPEAGEQGLGLFTHRMIVGLCGPANDPATGDVMLSKLLSYLQSTLGEQHRPQLLGQHQTPLILVGQPQPTTVTPPTGSPQTTTPPATPAASKSLLSGYAAAQAAQQYAGTATVTAQTIPQRQQEPTTSGMFAAGANPQYPQRQQEPTTSGMFATGANPQYQQMLAQAQQLLQSQNYPEAYNLVERVLQFAPNDTSALTLKGQILGAGGRYQEALSTTEQLVQIDPNNALAWSMRAVVLSNLGYYQDALSSIERSLELDTQNAESYAIKTNIMGQIAMTRGQQASSQPNAMIGADQQKRGGPFSFLIGAALQIGGLIIGSAGAGLLIIQPGLPVAIAFMLMSIGLAILCVNSARGAFRYGISRLLLTILTSLLVAGILGITYVVGYTRIIAGLQHRASLLQPILFFVFWAAAAAIVPLIPAIGGLISGMVARRRAN